MAQRPSYSLCLLHKQNILGTQGQSLTSRWPWLRAEVHPTPAGGKSSRRVICPTCVDSSRCDAGISLPSSTLHFILWPRESKQAEAAHRTFMNCCKQCYPIFLPDCCSLSAFPSPLVVEQVLCSATIPKLEAPSLLWLRRRKEAGGQTVLQSLGLLGGRCCCGSSGAGWAR